MFSLKLILWNEKKDQIIIDIENWLSKSDLDPIEQAIWKSDKEKTMLRQVNVNILIGTVKLRAVDRSTIQFWNFLAQFGCNDKRDLNMDYFIAG